MGSISKNYAALNEINMMSLPLLSIVDGSVVYSGGGVTFPLVCRSHAFTRFFLYKKMLLALSSLSFSYFTVWKKTF